LLSLQSLANCLGDAVSPVELFKLNLHTEAVPLLFDERQAPPRHFRSPHPDFNCEGYLRRICATSPVYINPLIHYVLFGAG